MTYCVTRDEEGMRVDRWFKKRFTCAAHVSHAHLENCIRRGWVRLEGAKTRSCVRLHEGQCLHVFRDVWRDSVPTSSGVTRVPSQEGLAQTSPSLSPCLRQHQDRVHAASFLTPSLVRWLRALVLYKDNDIIVLNKPAGLASQGGDGSNRNIDGFLEALQFDYTERPRLVHRLDKQTSGVFLLARTRRSALTLSEFLRNRRIRKQYWAFVVGALLQDHGVIDTPLLKHGGTRTQAVYVEPVTCRDTLPPAHARRVRCALSEFWVRDRCTAQDLAWVVLEPHTGRTHQLRAHMALVVGAPILGDDRYGRSALQAHVNGKGKSLPRSATRHLCLHAHSVLLPHPHDGRPLFFEAPLPPHMKGVLAYFHASEPS